MRNNVIQSWRGLAIIAVMLIHTSWIMYSDEVYALTRPLMNFSVPLFFFISGYFAKFESRVSWKAVKRILVPYVIWSVINYELGSFFCHMHGEIYHFEQYNIAEMFFFGYSGTQMYYLIVLLEMLLLTPLIYRFRDNRVCKVLCLSATPVCIVLIDLASIFPVIKQIHLFQTFLGWLTYYYLGILDRQHNLSGKTYPVSMLCLMAFACMMGYVVEARVLSHFFSGSFTTFSVFLYVLIIIQMLKNDMSNASINPQNTTWLSKIGDYSFFMYLSHLQVFRGGVLACDKNESLA